MFILPQLLRSHRLVSAVGLNVSFVCHIRDASTSGGFHANGFIFSIFEDMLVRKAVVNGLRPQLSTVVQTALSKTIL